MKRQLMWKKERHIRQVPCQGRSVYRYFTEYTVPTQTYLSLPLQQGAPDYADEIRQLEAEGDMPIDELLSSLPQEILEGRPMTPESIQGEKEEGKAGETMQTEEGEREVAKKVTAETPEEAPTAKKEDSVVEERRKRFVVYGRLFRGKFVPMLYHCTACVE